jgi:hypothetical protein
MPELSRRSIEWAGAFALSVLALLAPAIYNGFPLLFPDSDAYMKVTYGLSWTLDRSGFYGLFLRAPARLASGSAGLWLAILIQALIASAIQFATARRVVPAARPVTVLLVVLAMCLLTSLPWHVAQLMPDAFAGVLVLLAWLAASRDFDRPGTLLLWLAAAFLTLAHYTYLGLFAAAASCTLLGSAMLRVGAAELARRGIAILCVLASVVCAHVAANGLLFDRWTVSPAGSWFLFARLNEDGLTTPWLERHCGRDAPAPLSQIRKELPRDSQVLLWSRNSPLYPHIHGRIASPEYWRWMDMFAVADRGSIAEQRLAFARNALVATAHQLATFRALDDECPSECTSPALIGLNPSMADEIHSSRQLQGTLPKGLVRAITGTVTWAGLILLIPFALVAARKRDWEAFGLLLAAAAAIVANAALAGALSDVHDRYQSRVVWIVPFVEALLIWRWSRKAATAQAAGKVSGKKAPQNTAADSAK